MKKYFLPLIVIASCLGTSASAQVFRGGGSSGTACPSGSQYKGNGFCSSSDGKQFFRGGGNSGSAFPLAVSIKETDSANQLITNNFSVVVDLAERLAVLVLSTKGIGSAKAIKF